MLVTARRNDHHSTTEKIELVLINPGCAKPASSCFNREELVMSNEGFLGGMYKCNDYPEHDLAQGSLV